MPAYTLVSHHLCPYVQRAAIVLCEKGVSANQIYVDLGNKPDWFTKLSPLGKVPLLQIDDRKGEQTILFESAVILEYLDETLPYQLHPESPLERARHRAWMEFGSACLSSIGRFYNAIDTDRLMAEAQQLADLFERLEQEIGAGTWFGGEYFSMVDAVYGPIFRYFDTFDTIGQFGILSDKPKLHQWRKHLANRESVKRAVSEDYPDRLTKFLTARQSALSAIIMAEEFHVSGQKHPHPSMSLGTSS